MLTKGKEGRFSEYFFAHVQQPKSDKPSETPETKIFAFLNTPKA